MPRITLPDGSIREFDQPVTAHEVAADMKIPFLLVAGPRDAEQNAVSDRARGYRQDLGAVGLESFVEAIVREIFSRGSESMLTTLFEKQPAREAVGSGSKE